MKKILLFALTGVALSTYGQNDSNQESDSSKIKERFMCQHAELDPAQNKIFLSKNVLIETDDLFLSADSVIYDIKDQSLIAYGMKEFKFSGEEAIISERPKNIIRYKLKEQRIFVD